MHEPGERTRPTKKPLSARSIAYKTISSAFAAVTKSQGFERHRKCAIRRTADTVITHKLDAGTRRTWAYIEMGIWICDLPPEQIVDYHMNVSAPNPVDCAIRINTHHLAGNQRADLDRALGYYNPDVTSEERLNTLGHHVADQVMPLVDRCGTKAGLARCLADGTSANAFVHRPSGRISESKCHEPRAPWANN